MSNVIEFKPRRKAEQPAALAELRRVLEHYVLQADRPVEPKALTEVFLDVQDRHPPLGFSIRLSLSDLPPEQAERIRQELTAQFERLDDQVELARIRLIGELVAHKLELL